MKWTTDMRALRFEKTGDLGLLAVVDVPKPVPQAHEVLVQVKAAGMNKSDTTNVLGLFPYTTLPRTPGRDFAGTVVQGPPGWEGRDVFGTGKEVGFTRDGSHAQFLCLPADAVAIKPQALGFAQAAACGVPFVTAWHAVENTGVAAGTRCVVMGAAGAVGMAAIQMARMRGAHVLAAVRQPAQAARLQAMGFDTLLLSEGIDLGQAVRAHFPRGADMVLDAPGMWTAQAIGALAQFGRLATIVVPGDGQVTVSIRDLYRLGASIVGVNSLLYSAAECAVLLTRLAPAFEAGQLKVAGELETPSLEDAPALYVALRKGRPGKLVFLPQPAIAA